MAEKTTLPQVNYVSDNPEQDWERFQGAMKHILTASKDAKNDTATKTRLCKPQENQHDQHKG